MASWLNYSFSELPWDQPTNLSQKTACEYLVIIGCTSIRIVSINRLRRPYGWLELLPRVEKYTPEWQSLCQQHSSYHVALYKALRPWMIGTTISRVDIRSHWSSHQIEDPILSIQRNQTKPLTFQTKHRLIHMWLLPFILVNVMICDMFSNFIQEMLVKRCLGMVCECKW